MLRFPWGRIGKARLDAPCTDPYTRFEARFGRNGLTPWLEAVLRC